MPVRVRILRPPRMGSVGSRLAAPILAHFSLSPQPKGPLLMCEATTPMGLCSVALLLHPLAGDYPLVMRSSWEHQAGVNGCAGEEWAGCSSRPVHGLPHMRPLGLMASSFCKENVTRGWPECDLQVQCLEDRPSAG